LILGVGTRHRLLPNHPKNLSLNGSFAVETH